jgi:hypothetical protein
MSICRNILAATLLLLPTLSAAAQNYDPNIRASGPPQGMLLAPRDPVAYYQAKLRVRELVNDEEGVEDAVQAEPLAERLVREYPRDGENWLLLGTAKRLLKKDAEAAVAYERAGPLLGWSLTRVPALFAASSHLAAGNKRAALDTLRRSVFEQGFILRSMLYDLDLFVSLRDDPEFLEIVGRPSAVGWSRDYGWRRDIDFLRDEVKRANPLYRGAPLPAEFIRRQTSLKEQVPQLSDEQIVVGMREMLATLRIGHTDLAGISAGTIPSKKLPLQLWTFPEGTFVVSAVPAHKDLLGLRVLKIEDVTIEDVLRKANATQSIDGDMEYLLIGADLITSLSFLKAAGIVLSMEAATLTFRSANGKVRKLKLEAVKKSPGTLKLPPPPNVPPPMFLSDVSQAHWERMLPERDALYVQLNQSLDDKDETLREFGLRLRKLLTDSPPANLIVDVRHNTGGSTHSQLELLRTVVGFSLLPGRQVYVLIGRANYSAGANLITDLERLADPVFVGEASSECCVINGDPSDFRLPYSRVTGRVAAVRWNLSWNAFDGRREMSPEVPAQLSASDYLAGRDPALEAVFKIIARNGVR